jgi:DNA-binding transcriptional LysR family regulator
MELRHIRYFLALLEEQSFTSAAKRCRAAQPSVTEAIHRLERDVGGKLFVRAGGSQRETLPTDLALAIRPRLERAFASVQLARASETPIDITTRPEDARSERFPPSMPGETASAGAFESRGQ